MSYRTFLCVVLFMLAVPTVAAAQAVQPGNAPPPPGTVEKSIPPQVKVYKFEGTLKPGTAAKSAGCVLDPSSDVAFPCRLVPLIEEEIAAAEARVRHESTSDYVSLSPLAVILLFGLTGFLGGLVSTLVRWRRPRS